MLLMNTRHDYYVAVEFADIRAFVAVAEARSISRAARERYLTQPAVTRRVQRIERALGVALCDRRRRPFALTVETYTYALQLALVARERGLGLVPARILARSPLRSRLRVRRIPGLDFPLTIWAARGRVTPDLEPVWRAYDRALIARLGDARRRQTRAGS